MQNNSLAQLKLRANEFIEDYERQATEREYQKQKLKQNIMLQIMSNRHKSQASQSNANDLDKIDTFSQDVKFKRSAVMPVSEDRALTGVKGQLAGGGIARSNSVPNALQDQDETQREEQEHQSQPKLESAEITFKMSKNRNNFQNDSYREENQREKEREREREKSREEPTNYLDQNETLREREPKTKSNKTIDSIDEQKNRSNINTSLNIRKDKPDEKSRYQPRPQPPKSPSSSGSETQKIQNIEQQIELPQKNAPIFLTLDEDQSMEASNDKDKKNKNYAFDIVMDKSEPIDDIEELRRKKIQEMEKKRLLRMEEFKKQEEIKKIAGEDKDKDNRRSNSYLKNRANKGSIHEEDPEPELPKSRSRKKIGQKQQKSNLSSQNIVQQSHYNMKPPQQPQAQRSSYIAQQRQRERQKNQLDYQQTPKTVVSEYRIDKSKGKNTIFRESPKRADKSASKYSQDPKIEPKERKNTFSKQSNKKLMITALANVCLPGQLNRKEREKLSEVIEKEQAEFFVFLFKEYSRKVIKAIYTLDATQSYLMKIYGEKAPQEIISENVQSFYRFDSGSREFKKLDGCKSFSLVVHAIDLA